MSRIWGENVERSTAWAVVAPRDGLARYASDLEAWSTRRRPWLPEEATYREPPSAREFRPVADGSYRRRTRALPAIAAIESIRGRKARCLVQVAGTELPVELPARILEARGLKPGMRFMWWMREDGSVSADDIDDLPPIDRLSAHEEREGQRLYEELLVDRASGDDWGRLHEPGS